MWHKKERTGWFKRPEKLRDPATLFVHFMLTNTTILILIEWFRAGDQYDIPSDQRYLQAKTDDTPMGTTW
jgi:hypothetical protein